MKIYLDNLIFSLQSVGGISVYWKSFLERINQSNFEVCLINKANKNNLLSKEIQWSKEIEPDTWLPITFTRIFPLVKLLPKYSIYHSSYFRISLQKNVCNIVTLHDLAAEMDMVSGWKKRLKIKLQASAIKRADGIICVSETTRQSLLQIYPDTSVNNTTVIYHGCSQEFYRIENTVIDLKQIIFIGGRKDYKNFKTCLNVMALLPDYHLIIIGGGDLSVAETVEIDTFLSNRYTYIKDIPTSELNKIYNQSLCLFYPSYYEGFGMPVIEAMKAGCAVITTATKAVAEVAGEAAILIKHPKDIEGFKNEILKLSDKAYRDNWVKKGLVVANKYNWENNFNETMEFYKSIFYKKFPQKLTN